MKRLPVLFCVTISLTLATSISEGSSGTMKTERDRIVEFETDEGTWMSTDISPDGRQIVFDLLGDIYLLSIDGGEAKLLVGGAAWDHQPRFSPDGKSIAFVSDRDGLPNLWAIHPDGSGLRQISRQVLNRVSSPTWCADSSRLIARRRKGVSEELWIFDAADGSGIRIPGVESFRKLAGPVCSPDGRYVYFTAPVSGEYSFYHNNFHDSEQLLRLDLSTGRAVPITAGRDGGFRPQLSRDGRMLAYLKSRGGVTSLFVRDIKTKRERLLLEDVTPETASETRHLDTLPGYAFTPDASALIISMAGKFFRVSVQDGSKTPIPFKASIRKQLAPLLNVPRRLNDEVRVEIIRWPTIAPDGSRLVFSALAKLWQMDLPRGAPRRLTQGTDAEYAPAFSPDGKWLVYSTWSDREGGGHLMLASADGSGARPLTDAIGQYLNPAWSLDSKRIVFVRGHGGIEMLQQEAGAVPYRSELLWVEPQTGRSGAIGWIRSPSVDDAGYQTASISSDGNRVFYVDQTESDAQRLLVSAALDGQGARSHLQFPPGDVARVSPDGAHVAIVRGHKVFVVPLAPWWPEPIVLDLDQPSSAPVRVLRVNSDRADFLSWRDERTFIWAAGSDIYQQRLPPAGSNELPAPELLAEVSIVLPRARPEGSLAIVNARIITMRGEEIIDPGTIVVEGNRIYAVGSTTTVDVPPGTQVFDATGRTIIPGLIDTHVHMHQYALGTFPQQKWEHVAALAYGVTTSYNPSSRSIEVFELRDMVDAGIMLGPRIYSSGTILGGYFPESRSWFAHIGSLDEARDALRGHQRHATDVLKEYMHPRRDQRQYLVEAAREAGMTMTGEIGSDLSRLLSMALDGYTAVEHSIPIVPVYRDVIELLARSETFHTPTFSTANNPPGMLSYFTGRGDYASDEKLRRFLPPERMYDYERWRMQPDAEWYFMRQAAATNRISAAGGNVSMGSHSQFHGIAAHWELWARALAGGNSYQILRDATLRGAQKLGLENDLGSIEPGKFADFLILDADPRENIYNTERIERVVKDGFMYEADSMTQVWPNRKPLLEFFWQQPER